MSAFATGTRELLRKLNTCCCVRKVHLQQATDASVIEGSLQDARSEDDDSDADCFEDIRTMKDVAPTTRARGCYHACSAPACPA